MSWITTLYETFDNIEKQGGEDLLPISHSRQNAHVELNLNERSEVISANLVSRDNAVTQMPVTEKSASRGGGNNPHPLCDKLQYLAGDYQDFGGTKDKEFHERYMEQLKDWVDSDHSNKKVEIIYRYLKKGKLIADLVKFKVLTVDEERVLHEKFQADNIKLSAGSQLEAFIRFRVTILGDYVDATWKDKQLIKDYQRYYASKQNEKDFCYTTGEVLPSSVNHPSGIRNSGDKAKIISSNDKTNFTYKGRFHSPKEAMTISYVVSQKAHNALKWLIEKQGQRVGGKVFVLWGTDNQKVPVLLGDTQDFFKLHLGRGDNDDKDITKKGLSEQFNLAISGYKTEIRPNTKLALIGIDAATQGRMSIIFYREYNGLEGHELIDNIENWHRKSSWYHRYKFINKKIAPFYGAPSPYDIAKIAFGTEQNKIIKADDKLVSNTVERLLPCISDGRKVPKDISLKLVEKAKHPQNYRDVYNWYKVLTVTCSVYRKFLYDYKKEEFSMQIKQTQNLAYNCGRLLAVADAIETRAMLIDNKDEIRTSNAIRYFTRFSMAPATTWKTINERLIPYKKKLGAKGVQLYKLLGEISSIIDPDEFKNASNLDGCMVLGYDTQRQALFTKSNKNKYNKEEKNEYITKQN